MEATNSIFKVATIILAVIGLLATTAVVGMAFMHVGMGGMGGMMQGQGMGRMMASMCAMT